MRIGSKVVAVRAVYDEGVEVCRPGDKGRVVAFDGKYPTVRFERTGRASIVDPADEIREPNERYRYHNGQN